MTLEKNYNPKDFEQKIYAQWEESGVFEPTEDSNKESFCIMMPPPNVTGTLHLGHALDNTLPDALIRRARMQGKDAIYQPGTDHASIAVHVVLDKQFSEEGTNRFELGREEFLKRAWKWKDYSHGVITNQMRRLGVSCAWQRERFTMDDGFYAAVQKVFVDLHNKGLIYRGQRLVNWDPSMQTAVSDLEVKHKEVKGKFYHVRYPFADGFSYNGEDFIRLATTRPETILADGAIAINPEDPRAKDLVGKFVMVPIVNRRIPIIADNYVDPEFGAGMVKITAAHDFNDFDVYKRHKDSVEIPLINLMTPDAKMNENCPEAYQGLDRFVARKKVIEDFDALGLLDKIDDHVHTVPMAERNDTILEPYLTQQWYVDMKPLAKKCLASIGDVKFINDRDRRVYTHWLENIEDWCISRQLWWGHRIPAWYHNETGEIHISLEGPEDKSNWTQDEDVLDTWFSSALWPFGTQGWPEKTEALAKHYPNAAIMPGRDILPFWVMKMMMMGLEFMDESPFKTIYTHGMILDEKGQKMSKSKGNIIDPLILMDEYGADAVRFTMASIAAMGAEDMRMSTQKVEQSRNFCTKLWNAARYGEMAGVVYDENFDVTTITHPVNKWIVGELGNLLENVDSALDKFRFAEAANSLYHFTWGTWCDWYLELTKPLINGEDVALAEETRRTMGWAFEKLLRMLHPVIPFITDEIWRSHVSAADGESLISAGWPTAEMFVRDESIQSDITWLQNVISAVRTTRSESKVAPKAKIAAFAKDASEQDLVRLEKFASMLNALAGLESITPRNEVAGGTDAVAVAEGFEIILPLEGLVDFAAERARIEKEIIKFESEIAKIDIMLNNPNFVARAPEAVVESNKQNRMALVADMEKLKASIASR